MPTKLQWVNTVRKFAAEKNIILLSNHTNDLGRYYDDNQNMDLAFNLLQERCGHKMEGSDYRKLKELLR